MEATRVTVDESKGKNGAERSLLLWIRAIPSPGVKRK